MYGVNAVFANTSNTANYWDNIKNTVSCSVLACGPSFYLWKSFPLVSVSPLSYQTFNLNYGSLTFVSVMCMHETLRPLRCNTPTAGEAMRGSFDGGCIAALLSLTLNSWKFFPCYKHSNFLDFQPIPREFRYSVLASLEPRLLHSQ